MEAGRIVILEAHAYQVGFFSISISIETRTNNPISFSIELFLDYDNVGCYQDRTNRDMGMKQRADDGRDSFTIDECSRLCKSRSFKYFAMQFGGESQF